VEPIFSGHVSDLGQETICFGVDTISGFAYQRNEGEWPNQTRLGGHSLDVIFFSAKVRNTTDHALYR